MLLLCILISSPVSLVIPEGNWLSPEYNLVEEWSLNPLEYVSTERVPLGCITESEEGLEYTWDITLLDENRVIRFEDDQQVDQMGFDFPVCQRININFSPGGDYLLFLDEEDGSCLRINLEEMQSEWANLFEGLEPGNSGQLITDSGSIFFRSGYSRRIFNEHFDLIYEYSGGSDINEFTEHDSQGNRFYFTSTNTLLGINGNGEEIWVSEISAERTLDSLVSDLNTDAFGRTVAVQRFARLQLFNGETGNEFFRESREKVVANPVFSPSGDFLAVETYNYDEMMNFANGIRLYRINSSANEIQDIFHSIYSNRESPRLYPISVSDNGYVLATLYTGIKQHRLILLDSSGSAVWLSELFSLEGRFFPRSCGVFAGMTSDGNKIWYFDGRIVRAYRLESE